MNKHGFSFNTMIIIIYAVLAVMLGIRVFKGIKARKELKGEVKEFKKKASPFEYVLIIMLIVIGALNFISVSEGQKIYSYLVGIMMFVIALFFFLNLTMKIKIAENGILADGSFNTYKEIKKWGFDKGNGDLVMLTKVDHQEEQKVIKARLEDMVEINNLIRKYKLGK